MYTSVIARRCATLAAILAALLLAVALTATAGPARASTGGTPDGDGHPNVGFLAFYADGDLSRCTGTLVSPRVVLTAGHCAEGTSGKILVSFDPVISERPPAVPVAADLMRGYSAAEIDKAGFLSGTAYANPAYKGSNNLDDWNDVGVVVLDRPASGIAPARIATIGTLDAYAQPLLNKTMFTAVGYGSEMGKPSSGPQRPRPISYPLIRRYVVMPGQKLTPQILQTNGNEKDTRGTGGTCFGDSGGPVFLDGEIVAVTSYSNTDNCRYLHGYQRVDIKVVRNWLAGFGL